MRCFDCGMRFRRSSRTICSNFSARPCGVFTGEQLIGSMLMRDHPYYIHGVQISVIWTEMLYAGAMSTTNSLDSGGVSRIADLILEEKERGALVVLTCHDRNVLEAVSDVICTIEAGRITGKTVPGERAAAHEA